MADAARLFDGWEETMLLSCIQGHMGRLEADDPDCPAAARITVGDFCFLAGTPSSDLAAGAAAPILVPRTPDWHPVIETVWGAAVRRTVRYATRKDTAFDRDRLRRLARPGPGTALSPITPADVPLLMGEPWSQDQCGQFRDGADFCRRGIGVAARVDGRIAAAAGSYTVYDGGIEIQIDTHPDYRCRGLGTMCGAALILMCLDRGLYPSWDAVDRRSLSLAEKLGYVSAGEYPVYIRQ